MGPSRGGGSAGGGWPGLLSLGAPRQVSQRGPAAFSGEEGTGGQKSSCVWGVPGDVIQPVTLGEVPWSSRGYKGRA